MADEPLVLTPEQAAQQRLRKTLVSVPLLPDQMQEWFARIDASKKRVTDRESEWDTLLQEYLPTVNPASAPEDVKTNSHFRNIHTKSGQLFVQSPHVRLSPKQRMKEEQQIMGPDGMPRKVRATDALAIRQAVINQFMGPDYIDGAGLMDECVFDMQGYSGLACVFVDYRSYNRPAPDPANPQQQLEVPIHQEWIAEKFSTKKLLLDEQLRSSQIQKHSRWIGREFFLPKRIAARLYGLTEEQMGAGCEKDDRVFEDAGDSGASTIAKDYVRLYGIWYKCAYFTDDLHPQKIYELVLCDTMRDVPVVHQPWRHQTFDELGQLTEDSLDEFPIKVGSLRVMTDSPFPKPDSAFTNAQVKQLNTYLQQMIRLRDVAIGKYFYDTDAIDEKDLVRMRTGEVGAYIGMKPGMGLQGWDKIFYTTAQVKSTPDDWRTIAQLKSFMDETLGISATQSGAETDTVRSASEINRVAAASQGRQNKEKNRVVAFYLSIVRAVDTLVFRYAAGDRYVELVGPNGVRRLEMWNKQIGAGKFSYEIKPDSQLVHDAARDRQQLTGAYNVMAPDPLVNRAPMLREMATAFGMDPLEVVKDENAVNAQMMAQQATGIPMGQPPTGGGPINKHQQERSGAVPNAPGAAQSGDNRQERNPRPGGPA